MDAKQSPRPSAEECKWAGWYRAPRLASGCLGFCVPDDIERRVPRLTWKSAEQFCRGCQALDTSWSSENRGHAVIGGIDGFGEAPTLFQVGIMMPDGSTIGVVANSASKPVLALRVDGGSACGRLIGPTFSEDGTLGAHLVETLGKEQRFVALRPEDLSRLTMSTGATFAWSAPFVGDRVPRHFSYSTTMVAASLIERIGIGDIRTGKSVYADELPGAPRGQYPDALVVRDSVFVAHYDLTRTEWWLYDRGAFKSFLGGPGRDVVWLASDGKQLIWQESRDPIPNGGARKFGRYDLYSAPFTTESSDLKPQLLMADAPASLSHPVFKNGWLTAQFYSSYAPDPIRKGVLLVRVKDGLALLPVDTLNWGAPQLPAKEELWAAASRDSATSDAETILRVPYASMKVVQAGGQGGTRR